MSHNSATVSPDRLENCYVPGLTGEGRNVAMAETIRLEDEGGFGNQLSRAVRAKFRPALIVMSGERVGVRVSVQGNFLIGRYPECALMLPDPGVSGQHALLEDRGGTWTIVDLGSTNGVAVNGQKELETDLKHGDKLTLGTTILRFEVQDDADRAYSEMIAELVHFDDLTDLYLRRRFDAELTPLIVASRASSRAIGLLAMDLDGIKAINDAHGHLFGAYTISEAGRLIGRLVAEKGFACRFGGDEFVAALPDHSRLLAAAVAEKIRTTLAAHPFVHQGLRLHPSISIGVAAFPDDAEDATTLFQRADDALYRAKRAGKNRVSL